MGWLVAWLLAVWIIVDWANKVSEEVEPIKWEGKKKNG